MQPPPVLRDAAGLAAWLAGQRNDLEPPATALASVIAEVRAALASRPGCLLARMSGSGATCFGLFPDGATARAARDALAADHPEWWVAAGRMLS
jgi:4-diphosphocytidyl-2-C-methyl-D-erythritol kinase